MPRLGGPMRSPIGCGKRNSVLVGDMLVADASHLPPYGKRGNWHKHGANQARLDGHLSTIVRRLNEEIAEQSGHIIRDCGDREPFHGGLQAKLQTRTRVHGFQQFLILLLKFDVDAGT